MIPFPVDRDPAALAEWVEAEALFGTHGVVSRADVQSFIQDEPLEDEDEREEDYDQQVQSLLDNVWQELHFRRAASGQGYPLTLERDGGGGAVKRKSDSWAEAWPFALLMFLGLRKWYSIPIHYQTAGRLFEHVVAASLKGYVGGSSRRVGWPVDRGDPDFESRVKSMASAIVAKFVSLETVSPDVKDHGLDVVAWRVFPDGRSSNWVILCQCTIGDDWRDKHVSVKRWERVLSMIPSPMNAVAFPFVLERSENNEVDWKNLSIDGGLVFDRLRLTRYLGGVDVGSGFEDSGIEQTVKDWLSDDLRRLEGAVPSAA